MTSNCARHNISRFCEILNQTSFSENGLANYVNLQVFYAISTGKYSLEFRNTRNVPKEVNFSTRSFSAACIEGRTGAQS